MRITPAMIVKMRETSSGVGIVLGRKDVCMSRLWWMQAGLSQDRIELRAARPVEARCMYDLGSWRLCNT